MLLALFIIENHNKLDLLLWEIDLAASECLLLKECAQFVKIVLEPILVFEYALILIPVTLLKSRPD